MGFRATAVAMALIAVAQYGTDRNPEPCIIGPRTIAGNFAADLRGTVLPGDIEHPGIWGLREAYVFPLTFTPPPGYRVRILRISGDLSARLTTRGNGTAWARPGEYVGVLAAAGINRDSQGSVYADFAADDTLMYAQSDISPATGVTRFAFRENHEGVQNAVLGLDNKLYFTVAKFLDETGYETHFEITFSSVRFQFEKESCMTDAYLPLTRRGY